MLAAIAFCVGAPIASGDHLATLVGTPDGGAPLATLVGTPSTGRVDAYEAPCIRTGYKVKLGDEWIPDEDLVDYDLDESEETPVKFLTLALLGERYSVLRSMKAWTLVPIELWAVNGAPGREVEELRFAGYARPGAADEGSGAGGPGVTMRMGGISAIGRFGEFELCREVEPLAGFTRGAIIRDFCADAGLTAVQVPDGAVYTKGIEAKTVKLLAWLQPFIEPEGWKLRELPRAFADGGPILEAWTPKLKEAPQPADAEWDLSRNPSFRIEPPSDVPSRYIVRGFSAVFVDEVGQKTTRTVTIVEDVYAPKVATEQQDSLGNITPTGFTPMIPELRVVQKITDTTVSRGDFPLSQEVEEQGWYNPRKAQKETPVAPGPDYTFVQSYIDEAGEFVQLTREVFCTVARQKTRFRYVGTSPVGATTQEFTYHLVPRAVAELGDENLTIRPAYVFGDQNSYATLYEVFGLSEEHRQTRTYNQVTGAEAVDDVESYGYFPVRSLLADRDGGTGYPYYIRADGQGQTEITASWKKYGRNRKRNLFAEGTLRGSIEERWEYNARKMVSGTGLYQYGDYDSHYLTEQLIKVHAKTTGYKLLSSGQDGTYERTVREKGKVPVREIVSGRVPQPQYSGSAWTFLRQEPIELVVDDQVIADLLGFRREVIGNDHVQSLAEAAVVIRERKARAAAYRISVTRHEALQRVGDTILLLHPDHACQHRGLIEQVRSRRSRIAPSQTAEYTLRVPW